MLRFSMANNTLITLKKVSTKYGIGCDNSNKVVITKFQSLLETG